jgi:hypothetical protein
MAITHAVMGRLMSTTTRNDATFGGPMKERFETMEEQYQGKLMELQGGGRKTTRMRF